MQARSMNRLLALPSLTLTLLLSVLSSLELHAAEVQTVQRLDVKRYMGKWYEIASIPMFFTRNCTASTATYTLLPSGEIGVDNACRKETPDGEPSGIQGRAWMEDPQSPGKLKISFFWPMRADYWILAIDDAYEVALVGEPDREGLWLLARTPRLDEGRIQAMLKVARDQGFDVSQLKRTVHRVP